jgi:hypothetical protein
MQSASSAAVINPDDPASVTKDKQWAQSNLSTRLSSMDATFLYLEKK